MVLFHNVVQIFTLAQLAVIREEFFRLRFLNRGWVGWVLVHVDDAWRLVRSAFHHLPEEAFGGCPSPKPVRRSNSTTYGTGVHVKNIIPNLPAPILDIYAAEFCS